jgi:hypothetical protein
LDDTVNAECYLKLLQDYVITTLQGMGVKMEEMLFQDGARPLMTNVVFHFLSKHFHD